MWKKICSSVYFLVDFGHKKLRKVIVCSQILLHNNHKSKGTFLKLPKFDKKVHVQPPLL